MSLQNVENDILTTILLNRNVEKSIFFPFTFLTFNVKHVFDILNHGVRGQLRNKIVVAAVQEIKK